MKTLVDMKVFTLSAHLKTLSSCELMVDDTVDGKDNKEKKIRGGSLRLELSSTRMWYAVVMLVVLKVFFFFKMSYKI